MTDTLRLRLVTPERLVLDEEVEEITAPGTLGEFGVLPNHTTFLSSLEIGGLTYKKGGEIHSLAVSDGFAEVEDDSVTVLCSEAAFTHEIDPQDAKESVGAAEEKIKNLAPTDSGFDEAQKALSVAQNRLNVVSKD